MQPASKTQVGGDHYKNMVIHPDEFAYRNNLGFIEGSIIKYVCRHRSKGKREDLEKARNFIDRLIEFEYGVPANFVFCEKGPDVQQTMFDPNAVIQPKIPARGFAFLDAKSTEKVRQQIEAMDADAAQAKAALAPKKDDTTVFLPAGINEVLDGMTKDEVWEYTSEFNSLPRQDARVLNADALMARISLAKERAKYAALAPRPCPEHELQSEISKSETFVLTTWESKVFALLYGLTPEEFAARSERPTIERRVQKLKEGIRVATDK